MREGEDKQSTIKREKRESYKERVCVCVCVRGTPDGLPEVLGQRLPRHRGPLLHLLTFVSLPLAPPGLPQGCGWPTAQPPQRGCEVQEAPRRRAPPLQEGNHTQTGTASTQLRAALYSEGDSENHGDT